jgi:hypothetical protein
LNVPHLTHREFLISSFPASPVMKKFSILVS